MVHFEDKDMFPKSALMDFGGFRKDRSQNTYRYGVRVND